MEPVSLDHRFYVAMIVFVFVFIMPAVGFIGVLTKLSESRVAVVISYAVLCVNLGLILLFSIYSLRRSIDIHDDMMVVKSTFYSKQLSLAEIKSVEFLPVASSLKSLRRTNGVRMPGLKSGWFHAAGVRFFIDATTAPNIVLKTKDGDGVGLEVKDPAAFKAMLDIRRSDL